jgi:hypothetical protein
MLSGGEYVIRKSAVNKYGSEYLQMLNEGKVQKHFLGGAMGLAMAGLAQSNPSMLQNIAPAFGINLGNSKGSNQNVSTNTSPTSSVDMGTRQRDRRDNYFKYGGRVQRFFFGGFAKDIGIAGGFGATIGQIAAMQDVKNNVPKDIGMAKISSLGPSVKSNGQPLSSVGQKMFNATSTPVYSTSYDNYMAQKSAAASNLSPSYNYSVAPSILGRRENEEKNFFKYGGRVQKFATGGFFGVLAAMAAPIVGQKSAATNPTATSPTSSVGVGTRQRDNYFKYGGRVQRFASGGESQFLGANTYSYNDPLYPTAGENVIDPRLSLQAIIDPNNPQNRIRQDREMALYDYLNYVAGVNESNRQALEDNIRMNQEIQNQYNQQKDAKSKGAWYQALFGVAGAGLGFLAKGGEVRKFASGGSSKDDIPAMLMGGEFVMRKEAVNMYGKKFFDDLNSGRAKKFADGGAVGGVSETNSNNYSPTNNVSVVVNLNQQSVTNENTEENSNDEKRAEAQRTKELAEKVRTQVIRVITEQQRPGGLLSSAVYRKQQ